MTAPPASASPATAATARALAVRGNLTGRRKRMRRYPIAARNAARASSENSTKRDSPTRDSAARTALTAICAALSMGQPKAPVDTAGHRGKRHSLGAELVGDPERGGVARPEQRGTVRVPRPDGPDGVDDPPGGELARGRRDCRADGQAIPVRACPQFPARGEDRRAATTVDRPIHAPATEQGRVGRVDHRIDMLLGDVTDRQRDPHFGHDATSTSPGRRH
jgi:hypothetical protein